MNSRSLTSILVFGWAFATAGLASPVQEFQTIKAIETIPIRFPEELVPLYHEGRVNVAISVDDGGHLTEWLVTRYTDKLFADAAIAAVPHWKFEPARIAGRPISSRCVLQLLFEVRGAIVTLDGIEAVESFMHSVQHDDAYAPCELSKLDSAPTPLHAVQPAYPSELYDRHTTGTVMVDFYVDETGTVRMPSVVDSDQSVFAPFAVAAIRQWKFEPPTRKGRPVLIHVQQLFRFQPAVAVNGK